MSTIPGTLRRKTVTATATCFRLACRRSETVANAKSARAEPMRMIVTVAVAAVMALVGGCANRLPAAPTRPEPASSQLYQEDTVLREAENFFGRGAQGVADVLNRVFTDNGPPEAYIKGEEGGGAIGVGLRYGHGTVYFPNGASYKVYWRGPSLGLDFGGSAAKTFVLIYNIGSPNELYQRFGGVEGSLYYVGGLGVNYNRQGNVILAPVRFGVGWRQGINVGYLHVSPERSWIPF